MEKKTLVILTPAFAENEADLNWLPFLQGLVKGINRVAPSLEVIVLAFQFPLTKGAYKWYGNEVVAFGGGNKGKMHRLQLWLQAWRTLTRLKKEKNLVGLFSLWHTECALVGSYFGKIHNLKHRNWLCGQEVMDGNRYAKVIRAGSDELIAMSDFLQREFLSNYKVKPQYIIPVGVDPVVLDAVEERSIDVFGVGSLIPIKQYHVFVEVVNKLRVQLPAIKAMICGGGAEKGRLQALIDSHGIQRNITLAGETPHNEVLRLMQRAKVFLHTSSYEGFGTVCLEALSAGAHVVSFTRPMDRDISHWHHVSNLDEMVAKVNELLADKTLDHTSVCPYSVDHVAQEMVQLYAT